MTARPPAPRGGFTLVEVIVALTLTAISAAIAASALGAARRTADVVSVHQATADAGARWRSLLGDALRHGVPAAQASEPLLRVEPTGNPQLNAGSILRFLSRGIEAPFGTGAIWRVTVRSDGDQLIMDAEPLDATGGVARRATLPGVHHLDVRVLEEATARDVPQWRADWPLEQVRPMAAALSWREGTGGNRHRMVVTLDPLAASTP
jgi:prepilin-type N-terminal cleavage/methylation domain-containing protein